MEFGIGDYDKFDGKSPAALLHIRSLFLSTVNKLIPHFSDIFIELIILYSQIPLFCYQADEERKKNNDVNERWDWTNFHRIKWNLIEDAWKNRSIDSNFEIKFDYYFATREDDNSRTIPLQAPTHKDPKIGLLVKRIFDWSKQFNLNFEWCREMAFETIDLWLNNPEFYDQKIWWNGSQPPHLFNFIPTVKFKDIEFIFKYPTLYPSEGIYTQVKKEITEDFVKQLDTFLKQRKQEAKKLGLEPVIRKRNPEHFEYLAHFQVDEVNYEEIYKMYFPKEYAEYKNDRVELSERTKKVRKPINELAKLIGVKLREDGTKSGKK